MPEMPALCSKGCKEWKNGSLRVFVRMEMTCIFCVYLNAMVNLIKSSIYSTGIQVLTGLDDFQKGDKKKTND